MGERRDLRDLLRDTDFEQRRIIDDLSSYREEDQPDKDMASVVRRGGMSDFFKNLFVGLFLIAIVIGSFWVSFLVGKRVLVPPIKNIPTLEFPKMKTLTAMQVRKAEVVAPVQTPVRETAAAAPAKEQASQVVAEEQASRPTSTATVSKYPYKVVAGTYATQADAQVYARRLSKAGFTYYVKKTSAGWRVQAGAFDSKSQALALISRLTARGFSSKLVYE